MLLQNGLDTPNCSKMMPERLLMNLILKNLSAQSVSAVIGKHVIQWLTHWHSTHNSLNSSGLVNMSGLLNQFTQVDRCWWQSSLCLPSADEHSNDQVWDLCQELVESDMDNELCGRFTMLRNFEAIWLH